MGAQQCRITQQPGTGKPVQTVRQNSAGQGCQVQHQTGGVHGPQGGQPQARHGGDAGGGGRHGQPEHVEGEPLARIAEEQDVEGQQGYLYAQRNKKNLRQRPHCPPKKAPLPWGFVGCGPFRQQDAQPGQAHAYGGHTEHGKLQARIKDAQRRSQSNAEQGGAEGVQRCADAPAQQPEGQGQEHDRRPQQRRRRIAQPQIGQCRRQAGQQGQYGARLA